MPNRQNTHNVSRGLAAAAIAAVLLQCAPTAAQTASAELLLKRVTLSSSGVGYFEHEAVVDGNATLRVPLKLAQVDDVLKSLVVYDASGKVAGMSLPGKEPLAEQLKALPFDASALSDQTELLKALRGAEVLVTMAASNGQAGRLVRGRVLGLEKVTRPVLGPQVGLQAVTQLSLNMPSGVQTLMLEDTRSVKLLDDTLRTQIEQALVAISDNRARDGRVLELALAGSGKRTVRVGYVVPVPIWKTAYRLALPAEGDAASPTGALQAWAVLENLSGQDWRNVQLTLTTGRPVAVQQRLYDSYFSERPAVPIALPNRILPRADSAWMPSAPQALVAPATRPSPAAAAARSAPAPLVAPAPAAPAPARAQIGSLSGSRAGDALSFAQAEQEVVATQAGTLTSYRIELPVSVSNGRSLSVPVVMAQVPARRVYQWQPQVHAQHPLAAAAITNSTGVTLEPGAVTLYQAPTTAASGAFLGDAQLNATPSGDERMLAFAIDARLQVSQTSEQRSNTQRVRLDRQALVIEQLYQTLHTFALRNTSATDAEVVVELPRSTGTELLVPTGKVLGTAQSSWRVSLRVGAKGQASHAATVQQPRQYARQMVDLSLADLDTLGETARDDTTRSALIALASLRRTERDAALLKTQADGGVQRITDDQARLRTNLALVNSHSDLGKRYAQQLIQSEAAIEKALIARDDAVQADQAATAATRAFIDRLAKQK